MRRLSGAAILVAYLLCALLLPELHRRHHAQFGDDHEHVGDAIVFDPHVAADADFTALQLDFVGGAAEIDCSLAEYTLVSCENPQHPPAFGDDLYAHRPHRPDPTHGRGALAHLSGWLLAPAPVLPPPPPAAYDAPPAPALARVILWRPATVSVARGPPTL